MYKDKPVRETTRATAGGKFVVVGVSSQVREGKTSSLSALLVAVDTCRSASRGPQPSPAAGVKYCVQFSDLEFFNSNFLLFATAAAAVSLSDGLPLQLRGRHSFADDFAAFADHGSRSVLYMHVLVVGDVAK